MVAWNHAAGSPISRTRGMVLAWGNAKLNSDRTTSADASNPCHWNNKKLESLYVAHIPQTAHPSAVRRHCRIPLPAGIPASVTMHDAALDVLGDAGRHARSAVGVAALPLDSPVEVEAIAALI
jgi:hypothetical protein